MKRSPQLLLFVILGCFGVLTGCSDFVESLIDKNPNHQLTMSATERIIELIEANELPGIGSGEASKLTSSGASVLDKEVKYPVTRTFTVVKKGDAEHTYHYTLRKEQGQPWELIEAERSDSQGAPEPLQVK